MVIEIFTPGFVILWFGIAFLLTAIPVYFEAPLWVIILTYSISLFVLTVFVRKIVLRISSGENSGIKTNADAIIAQQGIVVEEVNRINGTGRVRVNRETWTAVSYVDDVIRINDKVEVCSVEGVKLVVKRSI
jgi:membrane protein implicated in regulation of membrane protease activity